MQISPKRNYIKSVRNHQLQQQNTRKMQNSQNAQDAKNSQEVLAKKEQRALKVSMISALILAVFGISFGVWAQSLAVMFDGFVALVSVGLGFLSVVTSRYIYKEDDDVFQYGYVRFEPMVNLFKSLILVFVCVYAFINAASSLVSGGYEVKLDSAVIYSICAFVFCAVLFAYTRIYATSLESDLIRVDNTEWKIDCVLYLGALAAFGVIYLLLRYDSDFAPFARYVDPLLLAVLSLMLAISPIRICIANFKDLIMVAPPEIDKKITQIMENLSLEYGFSDYDTHTAKSGRFYMIEVNILLPSNASYGAGAGGGVGAGGAESSGDLSVDSGVKSEVESASALRVDSGSLNSHATLQADSCADSHKVESISAESSNAKAVEAGKIDSGVLDSSLDSGTTSRADSGVTSCVDSGVRADLDSALPKSSAQPEAQSATLPSAPKIHSIQDVDNIRERIEKALEIPSYKIWLSVSFTANPKWL